MSKFCYNLGNPVSIKKDISSSKITMDKLLVFNVAHSWQKIIDNLGPLSLSQKIYWSTFSFWQNLRQFLCTIVAAVWKLAPSFFLCNLLEREVEATLLDENFFLLNLDESNIMWNEIESWKWPTHWLRWTKALQNSNFFFGWPRTKLRVARATQLP